MDVLVVLFLSSGFILFELDGMCRVGLGERWEGVLYASIVPSRPSATLNRCGHRAM